MKKGNKHDFEKPVGPSRGIIIFTHSKRLANTLICVVTTFWGIPHNVIAMVFTAADSFFRISPYCRIDNFLPGVTHNAGFFTVPQIVG